MYYIVYYVIRYRRGTVHKNLELALPNLSKKKRLTIQKKYYHHFCDMFLEMIKTMTISDTEINKRFTFTNLEVYKELEKKEKSIVVMCAHYASYEWLTIFEKYTTLEFYVVYKKIKNDYFDNLVCNIRRRFNAIPITTKETIPVIINNKKNNKKSLYGFVCDQSPKKNYANYWTHFMGIETPVQIGPEILSKRYDMNVLFLKTRKVRRGYYQSCFEILSNNTKDSSIYEITNQYIKLVEKQIHEAPEYYLWSHKRWKHNRPIINHDSQHYT
jgi:Kdo2-lipid IVA lauroyltransferase/acyltransferase